MAKVPTPLKPRPGRRAAAAPVSARRRAPPRSAARTRAAEAAPAAGRQRLLAAGLALAQRDGLRALSVRAVAARAGVNLGSFVYHFGTRDAFVAELIESWYAPFYAQLQSAAADGQGPALQRLRVLLLQFVDFVSASRVFVSQVLMDAAAGEKPARAFMQSLSQRHPLLLLRAIGEAQAAGALRREDPVNVLLFLLGGLLLPMLFVTGLDRGGILPRELGPRLRDSALDRDALVARLDWALRGLAP
jgi:AcrR family transcriptional regulator